MSTLGYSLKLQNPDDVKKIADFAIVITKDYSIRDLGYEMIPNNEEDLYAGCGFLINECSLGWYDETCHLKHMDYFKLIGEIARRYPDVSMSLFTSVDPEESCEWEWDGEKWNKVAVYDIDEDGDLIKRVKSRIEYWDEMIRKWEENPDKTISEDIYLSGYTQKPDSPLYKYYEYHPEPYFGDPENCCAVILNLNPGFGIPADVNHPDYRLQKHKAENPIPFDFRKFSPYLDERLKQEYIRNGRSRDRNGRSRENIPSGFFWWSGTYKPKSKTWSGGRIDYIHHLYRTYFNLKEEDKIDKKPFALEICPWHSKNFRFRDIFPSGMTEEKRGNLIKFIKDNVITPALEATKGKNTLPFVICIGSTIKDIAEDLQLRRLKEWNQNQGMSSWPKRGERNVLRSYTLYQSGETFLLNISAPGSNKPPGKKFRDEVEPHIISEIRGIIQ